jgi:hypothetical protein
MKDIFIKPQGKDFVNCLSQDDLVGLFNDLEIYHDNLLKLFMKASEISFSRNAPIDFKPINSAIVQEDKFKLIGEPNDFKDFYDYLIQRLTFFTTPSLVGDKVKNLEESIKTEIINCVPIFKKTLQSVYEILDQEDIEVNDEKNFLVMEKREDELKSKKGKSIISKVAKYSAKKVLNYPTEYGRMMADFNVAFGVKNNHLVIYQCGTPPFDGAKEKEQSMEEVAEKFKQISLEDNQWEQLAYFKGIRRVLALPDLIIKTFESKELYLNECLEENQ